MGAFGPIIVEKQSSDSVLRNAETEAGVETNNRFTSDLVQPKQTVSEFPIGCPIYSLIIP